MQWCRHSVTVCQSNTCRQYCDKQKVNPYFIRRYCLHRWSLLSIRVTVSKGQSLEMSRLLTQCMAIVVNGVDPQKCWIWAKRFPTLRPTRPPVRSVCTSTWETIGVLCSPTRRTSLRCVPQRSAVCLSCRTSSTKEMSKFCSSVAIRSMTTSNGSKTSILTAKLNSHIRWVHQTEDDILMTRFHWQMIGDESGRIASLIGILDEVCAHQSFRSSHRPFKMFVFTTEWQILWKET